MNEMSRLIAAIEAQNPGFRVVDIRLSGCVSVDDIHHIATAIPSARRLNFDEVSEMFT
jgi:hypothetical protein